MKDILQNKLKQFISVFIKTLVIIFVVIFIVAFAVLPVIIIDNTPYFIIPWIIFITALYMSIIICLFNPVDEK